MRRLANALYDVTLTLWVGGLWAVGYLVAPTLFATLGNDRQLAGALAGKLFERIGWIGLGCAIGLLLFLVIRLGRSAVRRLNFWLLLLMLLLAAVGLFGIQPLLAQLKTDALPREVMESMLRNRFVAWHGVSSVLYLIQSLIGLFLVTNTPRGGQY